MPLAQLHQYSAVVLAVDPVGALWRAVKSDDVVAPQQLLVPFVMEWE